VICEKPFAMNAPAAAAMQAAAAANGVRLFEAFHYRFHPAFDTLLGWLGEGRIGRVVSIDAHFDVPIADDGGEIRHRPEHGGGAMMDLGCYPLSWALEVVGDEPRAVTASATLTASGVDESMRAVLAFADGVEATLATSMAPDRSVSSALRIVGESGVIDFDNPVAPHSGASLSVTSHDGVEQAAISRITTFTYQLAAMLDAIAQERPVSMEGPAVLRQQRVLDAVYAAAGLAALRYGGDSA
jgi:predicted dehydrogenase